MNAFAIFILPSASAYKILACEPTTNLFYDLLEIYNNLIIFDSFKSLSIRSLHISPNYNDSVECYEMFRENSDDESVYAPYIKIDNDFSHEKFEYIFYETDKNNYFYSLTEILLIILKHQKYNGVCIIKINDIFYKPVVDCLYFLSSLTIPSGK